jgi:hypothetical protein
MFVSAVAHTRPSGRVPRKQRLQQWRASDARSAQPGAFTYFPLRAAGDEITRRFGQTTAERGLTRQAQGQQTVAALARSRPLARQWIQRLSNQLAKDGLIEFVDNPNHKRAKLTR